MNKLTTSNGYTVSMDAQWIYSQWTIPSLIHPGDVLKSFFKMAIKTRLLS